MSPSHSLRYSGRRRAGKILRAALFLLPLLFLAGFFFFPLAAILSRSLSLEAVGDLVSRPYYLGTLWFTLWQATLSTLLTLIAGLPAAYLFARFDFRGKSLLKALATVPFVLPTVVVAAAFGALLGESGLTNAILQSLLGLEQAPLRLEQSLTMILLAHVYYNIAVVVRLVGGFWANLNPRLDEAARLLGATPMQTFTEVTLPLLRPALVSATLLIFLFTFTSFGVILILGGPYYSTIETEIYRQYVTFLRADIAALLSLTQILFTFTLLWLFAHWQRQTAVPIDLRPQKHNLRRPTTIAQKVIVSSIVAGLCIFLISPLLALVSRSFLDRQGEFTLAYYQALPALRRGSIMFVSPLTAVRNSIGYALLTMLVAGTLGLVTAFMLTRPARWRSWLDPVFMLPLGVSAVTLGFGYVISMDRLRTSPLLILIAHTLVALPFVVRSLLPVLQGIRPNLREAAAISGASPLRIWREVDLPIVSRAFLVAAVFAFTVSMGEFGATSFIARPNSGFLTMPVAIQRYLSQPGALNFGQALAMSTILMIVCAAGFIAIERFRIADVGEF
jgi:thiamine transport system permease protein